jgi:hypothetical protein
VSVVYEPPPPIRLADRRTWLLRWGEGWFRSSLDHLCATWGLDPDNPEWAYHEAYRRRARRSVPTRWRPLNTALDRLVVAPLEGRLAGPG